MKITPMAQASGQPGMDLGAVSLGRTSPDKIAVAKAIAAGETPVRVTQSESVDPQVARMQQNVRRIKMHTQRSPDLDMDQAQDTGTQETAQSAISDLSEQAQETQEDVKPLSPQFAALAKQRRALQQERAKFEQEKVLHSQTAMDGGENMMTRLKSDPLGVLEEAGVSYEQLTEAILNGQSNPAASEIAALKSEIKALKEGVDKSFTDRDSQAEQQALAEMRREAERLIVHGDAYEMVRATRSVPTAIDLIHRVYKQTGDVMDVTEALQLVEDDLMSETLKVAQLPKLKSKLMPGQAMQPTSQNQGMRTLTNRDAARPVLDRRARALAAFRGTLTR